MAIYYDPDQLELPEFSALDPDAVGEFEFRLDEWAADIGASVIDEVNWIVSPGFSLGDGATPVTKKLMTVTPLPPTINGFTASASIWADDGTPDYSWCIANIQARAGNQIIDLSGRFQVRER